MSRPFRVRQVAPYAPLAVVGGGVIGFLLRGAVWDIRSVLHGGLIGFTCFSAAIACEYLLHGWFERRPDQWWRRAIAYFAASQVGWPLGVVLGLPLIWGQPMSAIRVPRSFLVIFLLISLAGTLVGLGVYGYEALKERLRRSVEQLKDREFQESTLR